MDDEADTGGAERAFAALRAEVAALRQAVEGQTAPDYALTLGAIVKELQAVGTRLTAIEGHPALAITPEGYSAQFTAAAERAHQAGGKAAWGPRRKLTMRRVGWSVWPAKFIRGKSSIAGSAPRWPSASCWGSRCGKSCHRCCLGVRAIGWHHR